MFKSGYVAILGKPNVGKSTLMNKLIGEKLSIVTSKPGTTRDKILGVLTLPDAQIVFVDTPGLHRPKTVLGHHMVREAKSSLEEADLVVLMSDVRESLTGDEVEFIKSIQGQGKARSCFLVLNKVDLVNKGRILPRIEEGMRLGVFKEVFPLSCLTGENTDRLLRALLEDLPEGAPYYSEDELTDRSERFFVGEIVREQALKLLKEEVPHSVAVKVEEMKERTEKNLWFIQATLFVEKDSQKAILIGKKGDVLKRIGQASRLEMEAFLSKKVFLQLWVKVLKNWRKDPKAVKELGYTI